MTCKEYLNVQIKVVFKNKPFKPSKEMANFKQSLPYLIM